MKIVCLLLSGLMVTALQAQNDNTNYQHALKVYNQTSFSSYTLTTIVQDSITNVIPGVESLQLFHPTIAFEWKNKGNKFHEIELTELRFQTQGGNKEVIQTSGTSVIKEVIDGEVTQNIAISARYEYILGANQTKTKKLVPYIGFGIQPFFEQTKYNPVIATDYPTVSTYTGFRTYVTPRLHYFFSEKIYLDVNIPFCVTDFYMRNEVTENPNIPDDQRNSGSNNFRLWPTMYSGRVGIGVVI